MRRNVRRLCDFHAAEMDAKAGTYEFKVDDFVKIRRATERFWVLVVEMPKGDKPGRGLVNNDLVQTDQHGFKCDNEITFTKEEVLDVFTD